MGAGDGGMATAYLSLGSNEGRRLAHLQAAVEALAATPSIEVVSWSNVWETQYVGPGEQAPYLNAAVAIRTTLAVEALLVTLKGIEARAGRSPGGHMRPRPVDLDILLYGDLVRGDDHLAVPHPQARNRAFVLVPLSEIAAEATFPDSGETIAEACAKIRRKEGPWVRLYDGADLPGQDARANKEERGAALALHRR